MKIDSKSQRAELWDDRILVKSYVVSTAKNGIGCEEGSLCTPPGELKVSAKIGDESPVGTVFKARVANGDTWPYCAAKYPADEDLVLTRILWLEGNEEKNANTLSRYIYLHGTNQEKLLGTPASHGCVRFSNKDIVEVFDFLNVGSLVKVIPS